jgi:hypothetical protein
VTESKNRNVDRLKAATLTILDSTNPASSLRPEVLEIVNVFDASGGLQHRPAQEEGADISAGETLSVDGLALSPLMAAMCADDYKRTVTFIRGLHAAIAAYRTQVSGRPVRVLYAGCGPFAMLAVPLMAVLAAEEVTFELLDMHAESVASANSIIDSLELAASVSASHVMNASDYQIDRDRPPDIILLEIMNACLEKEQRTAGSGDPSFVAAGA